MTRSPNSPPVISVRVIRIFYLLSPLVALGGAGLALAFSSLTLKTILNSQKSVHLQILAGALMGTAIAVPISEIVLTAKSCAWARGLILNLFKISKPTRADLVLTAVLAGFSEELLFRGVIQSFTGIWIASLVFALAHGAGLSIRPARLAYDALVFLLGVAFGITALRLGLIAAMSFHGITDLVFLLMLAKWSRQQR